MTYQVQIDILVKTFGKKFTHAEMEKSISDALWKCPEFRDVQIISYAGDTEENLNPFSDIRGQVLDENR